MRARPDDADSRIRRLSPEEKARRFHTAEFLTQMEYRRQREGAFWRRVCWTSAVVVWVGFGIYILREVDRIFLVPLCQVLFVVDYAGLRILRLAALGIYALLSLGLWAFLYSRMSRES